MSMAESMVTMGAVYSPYEPGGMFRLDFDADSDGFLDSNNWLSQWEAPRLEPLGGQRIYNNVGARHPNRTANLLYLDGHAATHKITYIMVRPNRNEDLWGRNIYNQ